MSLAKRVRRFGWPIILLILLISLIGNGWSAVERWQRTRVVAVPDGDSLQLKDGRRIRLLGIDAPERGRCSARSWPPVSPVTVRQLAIRTIKC